MVYLYQNMGSYGHVIFATNRNREVSALFDCEFSLLVYFDLYFINIYIVLIIFCVYYISL